MLYKYLLSLISSLPLEDDEKESLIGLIRLKENILYNSVYVVDVFYDLLGNNLEDPDLFSQLVLVPQYSQGVWVSLQIFFDLISLSQGMPIERVNLGLLLFCLICDYLDIYKAVECLVLLQSLSTVDSFTVLRECQGITCN